MRSLCAIFRSFFSSRSTNSHVRFGQASINSTSTIERLAPTFAHSINSQSENWEYVEKNCGHFKHGKKRKIHQRWWANCDVLIHKITKINGKPARKNFASHFFKQFNQPKITLKYNHAAAFACSLRLTGFNSEWLKEQRGCLWVPLINEHDGIRFGQ